MREAQRLDIELSADGVAIGAGLGVEREIGAAAEFAPTSICIRRRARSLARSVAGLSPSMVNVRPATPLAVSSAPRSSRLMPLTMLIGSWITSPLVT